MGEGFGVVEVGMEIGIVGGDDLELVDKGEGGGGGDLLGEEVLEFGEEGGGIEGEGVKGLFDDG